MAFEENHDEETGLPSCIRNVNVGTKRSVADIIPPLDRSSLGRCSNFINLFPNQSGLQSAIAITGRFDHRASSDNDHDGCSEFVTSWRPSASKIPDKQCSAQLTIFYGGTVNVYDDIPADKAEAIMLMASSGNYSRYPHSKVQNGCGSETEQKKTVSVLNLSQGSGIHPQPACRKVPADIPIARKQSVQRFLEKRKDRLNAKANCPSKTAEADEPQPHQHAASSSSPISLHLNSPPI